VPRFRNECNAFLCICEFWNLVVRAAFAYFCGAGNTHPHADRDASYVTTRRIEGVSGWSLSASDFL
jgi:hypothetical protein